MTQEKKDAFINAILENDRPWVLITHKGCMDGNGCILACNQAADEAGIERPEVYSAQYGQNPVKPDVKGKNVLIADFSFDRETLLAMEKEANSLVLIDHHESAEKELTGLDFCIFDKTHSGAVLTFQFLFPFREVPLMLKYIEDRDIWKWEQSFSKEVNAYLSLYINDISTLKTMYDVSDSEFLLGATTGGKGILEYQASIITKVASKQPALVKWGKYEIPCLNTTTLISEIGNELSKQYPFVMMYFFTATELVFSFRSSDPSIDLTKLLVPKGHKHAAGRSIPLDSANLDMAEFFNCITAPGVVFDMGMFLLRTFGEIDNQSIDIRDYYDIFNYDIFNNDKHIEFNNFSNNTVEYEGCIGEISYNRHTNTWYCYVNTGIDLIDAVGDTYNEVVDNFKLKVDLYSK
jgi:hypothetical protein